MPTPLLRRRSRHEAGLDRGRELGSSVSGSVRSAGVDARGQILRLAGDLEAQAAPTLEKWSAAARPHLDHAAEAVQTKVIPEVKDKAVILAAHVGSATETVRPVVSQFVEDVAERTGPAVQEVRARSGRAAAALRGEQRESRLGLRAVLLLLAGVAVGAVAGLLARRDAASQMPASAAYVAPVAVPDPIEEREDQEGVTTAHP